MDVVRLLKDAVEQLPSGDYTTGLTATLRHIQSAIRHFERDRAEDPDNFTDAIYRTNQAYEGSLKEAYRVLTGLDPSHLSPYQIESYLEQNAIVRPKVLLQLTRYRQDYRNPSTHDYKLDFDENEAILAILSVTAFAKLLVDQISAKVNFETATKEIADNPVNTKGVSGTSADAYFISICENLLQYMNKASAAGLTERENAPHIAAFLASTKAHVELERSFRTSYGWHIDWDIVINIDQNDKIGFDIKSSRGRQSRDISLERVDRLADYLHESRMRFGILVEGAARGEKYIMQQFDKPSGIKICRLGKKFS